MELNPEQFQAVRHIEGPLIIFAGAGSGKTRVIVHRIKNMLDHKIPGHSIVAVTFTNKSANEMKERLKTLVDRQKLRGMVISTFHSLGNRILQKEIGVLGYRKPYTILDETDRLQVLRNIYKELGLNPDDVKNQNILFLISLAKNSNKKIENWIEENEFYFLELNKDTFYEIYHLYHKFLYSLNSIDFDDLIILPIKIFKNYSEILEKYQRKYKYFLVDEFQDTNPLQYELLKLLSNHTRNVCVVGDDDQSIYGWRGADVSIIQNFKKDYPDATIVILNKNYRSTQIIIDAAYSVIKNNLRRIEKKVVSVNQNGEKIKIIECYDEKEEAELVAELIQKRILREKKKLGDFAILYRTNYQSRIFESELRKRNIPHYVVGGYRFFDRKEVKDILAYLRVIANPLDEVSLLRIINFPKRGIGEGTIEKIYEFIMNYEKENKEKLSFIDALYKIINEPNLIKGIHNSQFEAILNFIEFLEKYKKEFSINRSMTNSLYKMIHDLNLEEEFLKEGDKEEVARARMLNVSEIVNMLSYFEEEWDEPQPPTLFDFLSRISLLSSGQDHYEQDKGKVQLLTLHLSKGLEFDVVFLCGMNEKIFPAERSLQESKEMEYSLEEERRLYYVGITRAKKELILTYTLFRRKFGEEIAQEPSRFLYEIPKHLVDWQYQYLKQENQNEEKKIKEFINNIKNILTG
jgi:DNA helicase-2/ATP-dependent DNA helicase PcrA